MKRLVSVLTSLAFCGSAYAADNIINMKDNTFFLNTDTFNAESITADSTPDFQGGYTVSMHVQDKVLGFDVVATILSNPCYNQEDSYIVFRVPNEEHWSYKWNYHRNGNRSIDQIARAMCKMTLSKLGE